MEITVFVPGKANGYALLVGEGNFSFAAEFILKSDRQVVATCFKNADQDLSEIQLQNIAFVQKHGGMVYSDVDATQMENHPIVSKNKYDVIIFNFPHIPGKMNIRENRKLLGDFFHSAVKILALEGEIHVTLCKGQSGTPEDGQPRKWSDTWQIVALASRSDLILRDNIPFKCNDYPNYVCSGFRGIEKQFNHEGAMTYIFCCGIPINIDQFIYKDLIGQDITPKAQLRHCTAEGLHQLGEIMANKHHPINEILNKTSEESKKMFNAELTELTHCTLFCCHDNQHAALCEPDSLMKILEDCCTYTLLKTLLTEAIVNLRTEDVFIKNTLCFPCISLPSDLLHIKPCLLLFSKDHSKIISSTKILLNSIVPDSKININFSSEYINCKKNDHFNNKCYNLDKIENPLFYIDKPVCEFLSKLRELGLTTTDRCRYFKQCSLSLLATYSIQVIDGHKLYKNIKFIVEDGINPVLSNSLKIGTFGWFSYDNEDYYYEFLDIACVAMLAYHVFDKRVLYDEHACHITLNRTNQNIFRPLALHSPFYTHDLSFWLDTEFSEIKFILLIKNVLKNLVFSIQQIDVYFDCTGRKSVCYRFIYSSISQSLSKEKIKDIHIKFRETLQKHLNVVVR